MKVPVFVQKLFGSVTWRMPHTGPSLFLTFDDGPHPEVTIRVLEILKSFNAKATFFCVGENVEKYPDVFRRILQDGHAVGNHTYRHLNGWKTSADLYETDVLKCEEILEASDPAFPIRNPKLFRPPYGKLKWSQLKSLRSNYEIVMWDVLSRDYNQKLSGENCLQNVFRHARKGSIVVFHDSLKAKERVLHALPEVLEHFTKKNFSFRSL